MENALNNRSRLALRIALVGGILFAVFVMFYNTGYQARELLLGWGFPLNALLFHVGLGIALWARFGDEAKRGKHPTWAIVANAVPVFLFWMMVYLLIQALKTFT